MQEETIEKHIADLCQIKQDMTEKASKMQDLVIRLNAEYEGDAGQGNFKMRFNSQPVKHHSPVQEAIIQNFAKEYGLSLDNQIKDIDKCISFMQAVIKKTYYCEVDIFNKENQPVEC